MSTSENDPFSFSPEELSSLQPRTRGGISIPWMWVAIAEGVALLVIAILFIGAKLLPGLSGAPQAVVQRYYESLEAQDYPRVTACLDPDASLTSNLVPSLGSLVDQVENFLGKEVGSPINLGWDFQGLNFTKQDQKGDTAHVRVTGKVRVYEVSTGLGLTLPYDWTHELVRKNRQWYILP